MKALLVACWACVAFAASAAQYPDRPVRALVVTGAGGGSDLTMRIIADRMSRDLKQPFVVENRAGAAGAIATDIVAKATPDGYTILCGTSTTMVMLPLITPNLPYDPLRDLAPIGSVSRGNVVVVARATLPVQSLADLVKYAKANPDKRLTYATAGIGTTQHLAAELLSEQAGIEMLHIPYKGTALAQTDLVSGRIDLIFDNVAPSLNNINQGKARALAVLSADRVRELKDTPTTTEAGYPKVQINTWVGLFAPRGTPKTVIQLLSAELKRVLSSPDVIEALVRNGNDVVYSTPEELGTYVKTQTELIRKLAKTRNIKFE